jgi:hypothetical protein
VATDFRQRAFSGNALNRSGNFLGVKYYPKLHLAENFLRVIIYSILPKQIQPPWWDNATNSFIRSHVNTNKRRNRRATTAEPRHSSPGIHDLYFTPLGDLSDIIRTHRNHFISVIPDIDKLIVEIERVRHPRNIIAHMNYPNDFDRRAIRRLSEHVSNIIENLEAQGVTINIPPII